MPNAVINYAYSGSENDAVGEIESYVDATRALAIRQAQRKGRYNQIAGLRVVTAVARGTHPDGYLPLGGQ